MNIQNSEIILYKAADGTTQIEVKLMGETVWLTQKQMAVLFDCGVDNIALHLKNVYAEGELSETATSEESSAVQKEGDRDVKRMIRHYNLDAIISVGYRVNSIRGTQFRIWATQRLKEYIIKGFTMDDERLANGGVKEDYFNEWAERIRKIRTSERNFYLKVTDIFATSADYNPRTDYAQPIHLTSAAKTNPSARGSQEIPGLTA